MAEEAGTERAREAGGTTRTGRRDAANSRPTAGRHVPRPEESGSLEEYVSLVSHELRGPLATLIGYAQLLARGQALAESTSKKAASAVLEQGKRLEHIISNLLQASRLTGGTLRVALRSTDLVSAARQVVLQQQQAAPKHRLVVELPEGQILGNWDLDLLALAIGNLIENAVKFSPPNSEVRVTLRRDGDRATLIVTDRGLGIDPADMPELFRPYRRLARTQLYPGVGVGLYVAKGIVEAHGGHIGVESRPGEGTVVSFSLPVTNAPPG